MTLIAVILAVFAGMYAFRYDDGVTKTDLAKAGTKTLEVAAVQYRLKFGAYPAKLNDLVTPPNGPPFVEPGTTNDPWGRPYRYDPAGPKNEGKKPDIWTTGHDGELLGNWPEPKDWWEW
ncbi:MAG TPA: type II secretion system protein GspG [Gemmataceae bacterium]|nr:type II secretion system protein GspG [Gemmataceae bacterium]